MTGVATEKPASFRATGAFGGEGRRGGKNNPSYLNIFLIAYLLFSGAGCEYREALGSDGSFFNTFLFWTP